MPSMVSSGTLNIRIKKKKQKKKENIEKKK